ncbi:MAG: hypothetical protein QNJ94_16325 [Alphaproteobacteria bacterium]|nr:hypothetical protein [Alphaproteobacteria bacterium]
MVADDKAMTLAPERTRMVCVLLLGLALGALVWALSGPITGTSDAFEAPNHYYRIAMFAAGILAALPAPRYWWLAVVAIFLGERAYTFAVLAEEFQLWLLGTIVINFLVLTWLPAAAGALGTFLVAKAVRRRKQSVS